MCPPRGVELLSAFAVLHKPLALEHVPNYRARGRARVEAHAEDSDERALDKKRRRGSVPANVGVKNQSRSYQQDIPQAHKCLVVEMCARNRDGASIRPCSNICGNLVSSPNAVG